MLRRIKMQKSINLSWNTNSDEFLFVFKQMVMSLRVSELQVLLGYAGRNKHGRKHELLTKALHLLKAGCSPAVQMKIKELYRRRFPQKIMTPADLSLPSVHSSSMPATLSPSTIPQLTYDGHPAASPLLPVSLLGPKHELELPHLTSALHPVHPDIKLQKLPFYDLLDELIKPTSLGKAVILLMLYIEFMFSNNGWLQSLACTLFNAASRQSFEPCYFWVSVMIASWSSLFCGTQGDASDAPTFASWLNIVKLQRNVASSGYMSAPTGAWIGQKTIVRAWNSLKIRKREHFRADGSVKKFINQYLGLSKKKIHIWSV